MRIRNLSGYPMGLTIGSCRVSWLRSTTVVIVCTFLLSLILHGQHPISKGSVTVTFVDPEWSKDLTEKTLIADDRLKDFTQQTGIGVKHLPTPESALDQLDLVRKLLRQESTSPDVNGVDVIWPGVLSEELMDLKPHLTTELSVDQRRHRRQLHGQGKTSRGALSFRYRSSVLPKGFASTVWVPRATPYVGRTGANGRQDPGGRARTRAKGFLGIYLAGCGRRRFDL